MSGLFGYVAQGGEAEAEQVVERMGRALVHRAWQRVESASPAAGVGLGRVGLGLLNRGPQPARAGGAAVWLWLVGEFYHQAGRRQELERAGALRAGGEDAELALAEYLRAGVEGLVGLEGAFVVAVWDGREGELVLVNDRHGLYPHYYGRPGGGLAFGPEIKALLAVPGQRRRLDRVAVAQYARFQQLLGSRTWLRDVWLLPPASVARYRPGTGWFELARYWDWDRIGTQAGLSAGEAAEECGRLFQRAVDAMVTPPLRVGVYLSGGLDARTILGFLAGRGAVTTLTYGAAGCRDVVYAAELARRAGSRHRWFELRDGRWVLEQAGLHLALTEGMHSWMHAHGMSTLEAARAEVDVNLSGWDGGQILGGYIEDYKLDHVYRHPINERDLVQRLYEGFNQRFTWPGLGEAGEHTLIGRRGDQRLRGLAFESFREELERTRHYPSERRADYFYIEQHDRRSTQNMVVFTRSALEVRCPFFDYDFVTFIHSLPERLRTTPALHRSVLTRRAPELALVPWEKDERLPHASPLLRVPHGLLQRARHRLGRHLGWVVRERPRLYADYEAYLRTELRGWAEGILFDPRTEARGLFDPGGVRALWERHLSGRELWTIGTVAPLITIELVLRLLLDGEVESALEPRFA